MVFGRKYQCCYNIQFKSYSTSHSVWLKILSILSFYIPKAIILIEIHIYKLKDFHKMIH